MSVYPIILSQTHFTHRDDLTYPFEERGLQFGDGVYEVIRIYDGSYYLLPEHIDRLFRSAEAIKIDLPFSKEDINSLLHDLLEQNDMSSDGIVYLQATRGSAPRNHAFPTDTPANVYAYIRDMPRKIDQLTNGVSAITQRDTRWENCYIKSLNLLPNVIAKQEAQVKGCYEAILHRDVIVTECSSSNIYLVQDGSIYTHPATNNILHGCVRMRVEQFTDDLNIPFFEESFSVEDIRNADELFLSSSTSEVMPVVKVDGNPVADGKPGNITRQMQETYEKDANIMKQQI
ncbi:D-alanine aminotransferase apoenzyme [Lentibacillus halodurans]|uniref:D-alanine aminotransferase n=1 Tax=Lentibacillus halodurans TaxID=237679 RepID=A0A1I0VX15_9BACI|nr:D-amino-acid transaminase [Lentibacillus halodurans]SFA80433.1 D-alanine aminotransferase apoenzyme [Lentibacillus halodurans]